jgi:ribonuclease HIII
VKPFVEFYLEPEILKQFSLSHPEAYLDLTPRIGMDEAGKGDFFGPLCVAALYSDGEGIKNLLEWGIKDSKTLSDETILNLATKIRATYPHTVIRLFPLKYNELYARFRNLNRLLAWAHTAALKNVSEKTECHKAIIDQFAKEGVMSSALKQNHLDIDLQQRVGGESDLVVAGASILARAGFVEGLEQLSQEIQKKLPKGAAKQVIETGIILVKDYGPDILNKIAKIHFKTKNEILSHIN